MKFQTLLGLDPGELPEIRLQGSSGISELWATKQYVVKFTRTSAVVAAETADRLQRVHDALCPEGLAPALIAARVVNEGLLTIYTRGECMGSANFGEIGKTLACAHAILAGVPVSSPSTWIGHIGEAEDFEQSLEQVSDQELADSGKHLIELARRAASPDPIQYVHRDLHPCNILKVRKHIWLIDWEMSYGGTVIDDVAMTVCLLCDNRPPSTWKPIARSFLAAYRKESGAVWADLTNSRLQAAIAVAGLRQGIAGWITDGGDVSGPYWPNLRHRTRVALKLTTEV